MGDGQGPGWFPESILEQTHPSFFLNVGLSSRSVPVSEAEPEFVREEGVVGDAGPHRGAGGPVSLTGPRQASGPSRADLGSRSEEVRGGDGWGQVEVRRRGGGQEGG